MKSQKQRRHDNSFLKRYQKPLVLAAVVIGTIALAVVLYQKFYTHRIVAVVGDYQITQKETHLRDQVHRIFYPNDPKSYGIEELVRAYTYAQILKNNGFEITDSYLRNEDIRINQNTKSPETLAKIRAVFQGDEEAYKRVFILPTFAERIIYFEFFNKNPKVQTKSLARVQEFLKKIQNGNRPLSELATEEKFLSQTFFLSKKDGIEWQNESTGKPDEIKPSSPGKVTVQSSPQEKALRDQMQKQNEQQNLEAASFWMENIVPRLKPGEVLPEPVDFGENWLVVKYEKEIRKGKHQLLAVMIPKDNYEEWLSSEKARILIRK